MPRPRMAVEDVLIKTSFRLPAAELTRLEQLAAQRGTDRSEALRWVLIDHAARTPAAGDAPC